MADNHLMGQLGRLTKIGFLLLILFMLVMSVSCTSKSVQSGEADYDATIVASQATIAAAQTIEAKPTSDLIVPRMEPILPEAQPTPETTPVPVPTMDVQSALLEAPDLTFNIFVEYILDASGSMLGQLADHTRKRDVAAQVLSQRIRSFPPQINIGFRTFGHHMDWRGQEEKSCQDIELIAPVQTGQLESIALWLKDDYDAKGMTPLAQSIRYTAEDLTKGEEEDNAIILVSDGARPMVGTPAQW